MLVAVIHYAPIPGCCTALHGSIDTRKAANRLIHARFRLDGLYAWADHTVQHPLFRGLLSVRRPWNCRIKTKTSWTRRTRSPRSITNQHFILSAELDTEFPGNGFDTIFHAAERAMALYLFSLNVAAMVWAKTLPYEKAEHSLIAKFQDFPETVCRKAFGEAYAYTR